MGRVMAAVLLSVGLIASLAQTSFAAENLIKAYEAGFSLTVNLPEGDDYEGLSAGDITLDVYKIASAEPYEGSDTYDLVWDDAFEDQKVMWQDACNKAEAEGGAITASDVKALAQSLTAAILTGVPEYGSGDAEGTNAADPAYTAAPGEKLQLVNDEGIAQGGLYLVIPHGKYTFATKDEETKTELKDYIVKVQEEGAETADIYTISEGDGGVFQFAPILISVPSKPGEDLGSESIIGYDDKEEIGEYSASYGNTDGEGVWNTDVVLNAKVAFEPRKGSLQIVKTLSSWEERDADDTSINDEATFVFKVDVKKGSKSYYSNVITMFFDGTGDQESEIIEDLPIGAEATIEEIYSGNYTPDEKKKTLIIGDDPETEEKESTVELVIAEFENSHIPVDTPPSGGGSVENQFKDGELIQRYSQGSQPDEGEPQE